MLSGGTDGRARLHDVATGKVVHAFEEQPDFLHAVAWSRDGTTLATGCDDGRITIFDAAKRTRLRSFQHAAKGTKERVVWSLAFSRGGGTLFAATGDGLIRAWNPATGRGRMRLTGHEGRVLCVRVSPNGRLLASGADDAKVGIWDVRTGRKRYLLGGHAKSVYAVAWHPTRPLLASAGIDGQVRIWDTRRWTLVQRLDVTKNTIYGLAFDHDGRHLAVSCGSGGLYVYGPRAKARAEASGDG